MSLKYPFLEPSSLKMEKYGWSGEFFEMTSNFYFFTSLLGELSGIFVGWKIKGEECLKYVR